MSPRGVEVALAAGADLAEGPVWDAAEGVLWWVDIFRGEAHRFDPSTGRDEAWVVEAPIGSLALRASGGLVVALRDGPYSWRPGCRKLAPRSCERPGR